jgi:uncharacterized membrane protein
MPKYIITFLLIFLCSCSRSSDTTVNDNYIEAKVLEVMSSLTVEDKNFGIENQIARVRVKVTSGIDKDKEIVINQQLIPKINELAIPDVGDSVVLSETILAGGDLGLQIVDTKRKGIAIFSIFLLFIIMTIIGGIKGIVFAILLTSIFLSTNYILFPLMSLGLSSIFLSFIACNILNALFVFLIHTRDKFKPAIFSNFLSLFIVSIISYIFSGYGAFGSLLSRDSASIINQNINISSLISSSILFASLGVIISMNLYVFNLSKDSKKIKSESKDSIIQIINSVRPTMFINILFVFLIYLGLGLPVLYTKYLNNSLSATLNTDLITFYIVATSISGIGIISSAMISSFLHLYIQNNESIKKMRNIKSTQNSK